MTAVVYSIEGRGLKLNSAADAKPFADEIKALEVTDIKLGGNTWVESFR